MLGFKNNPQLLLLAHKVIHFLWHYHSQNHEGIHTILMEKPALEYDLSLLVGCLEELGHHDSRKWEKLIPWEWGKM